MKIKIILLAIFFIFFGCEKNNGISLALDWYPNSNHAGIYAALEEGYFDEANLNYLMLLIFYKHSQQD